MDHRNARDGGTGAVRISYTRPVEKSDDEHTYHINPLPKPARDLLWGLLEGLKGERLIEWSELEEGKLGGMRFKVPVKASETEQPANESSDGSGQSGSLESQGFEEDNRRRGSSERIFEVELDNGLKKK